MPKKLLLSIACFLFGCATPANQENRANAHPAPSMGPLFYRVTGNGASAYLFGTVHIDHELTRNLPAPIEAAFQESEAVYVELAPSAESVAEFMAMTVLDDGSTLDTVVGEALWAEIGDYFESAGQPREAADSLKPLKPWAAVSMMPSTDQGDGPVLDLRLKTLAREEGKEVHGLETILEQLQDVMEQPQEDSIEALRKAVQVGDKAEAEEAGADNSIIEIWASGDAERMFSLPIPGEEDDPELRGTVMASVWKRNEIMTERLDAALRAAPGKPAFVAVGAMHLVNPPDVDVAQERQVQTPRRLGMAELLRLRGYTVRRVNAGQ